MKLLLFGGFLGSGKTTIIIRLANALSEQGKRVVVLVNEVGEIGIDDQLMRQLGLDVWELSNGCICCSLVGSLVETLTRIKKDYKPEVVVVEASGAADPARVLESLPDLKGLGLEKIITNIVLDPMRLPMLYEVATPLITSQIQHADALIISKADIASGVDIASTRKIGNNLNPDADVLLLASSATEQWPIDDLVTI